jgi:hypothetical protein
MKRLNYSLGTVLFVAVFFEVGFSACSSKGSNSGNAGANGAAGMGAGGMAGTMVATPSATKPDGSCVANAYKHPTNTGVCSCQSDTPDVCDTVGCTDTMTDTSNCGSCGTACTPTATCNGGACGPSPTILQAAISGCTGLTIAVADGAVYYTDEAHDTVNKVGSTAPIATGEMGATSLAVQGTDLFWYDKGTKKIRMVAEVGGTPADVYTNTAPATDGGVAPDIAGFLVTSDGASVYISLGTNVIRAPVAGGASVIVAKEVAGGIPSALALNGTTNIVYPATFNGDVDAPRLSAMPAICGMKDADDNAIETTCPRLARSQGDLLPTFVAVVNGSAYWVDGLTLYSETIAAMGSTPNAIGIATGDITAAVAGTDTIYFAEDGLIEKRPAAVDMNSATPIPVARGQMAATSMSLDATTLYWATKDCSIASIKR